jgi:hypothetical protein
MQPWNLLSDVIHSVKSASVEKYGCAPQITLHYLHSNDPPIPFIGVPGLVAHAASELLKNAVKAQVDRYGVLGIEDAYPIVISLEITSSPAMLSITVADQGIGLASPITSFPFFASAWKDSSGTEKVEGSDWRYSRNFGAPLFGAGVGLARTFIHARVHGGSLTLTPLSADGGCLARVTFQRQGRHRFDPHPDFYT